MYILFFLFISADAFNFEPELHQGRFFYLYSYTSFTHLLLLLIIIFVFSYISPERTVCSAFTPSLALILFTEIRNFQSRHIKLLKETPQTDIPFHPHFTPPSHSIYLLNEHNISHNPQSNKNVPRTGSVS